MDLKWSEFERVEMRVGTVVSARIFAQARNPSYKLEIDFGEFGIRKSSAQITKRYNVDELVGRQVVAVLNFPPKQIGPFMSECWCGRRGWRRGPDFPAGPCARGLEDKLIFA